MLVDFIVEVSVFVPIFADLARANNTLRVSSEKLGYKSQSSQTRFKENFLCNLVSSDRFQLTVIIGIDADSAFQTSANRPNPLA
jgi:hypothetical protein